MAKRSVITVTTGEAGSGKSYTRCARFITDEFLPNHDGVHISNFPLGEVPEDHAVPPEYEGETFADRISKAAAALHGLDEADCRERIEMIPGDVLESWEAGESGPWEYFEGRTIQDCHIAIDEIHNFCDAQGDAKLRKRWRQWLGEIRHQGATVEFLSQALAKVPIEIRREAGSHIEVKNVETERDPVFNIEMGDWYELRAGLVTRNYKSAVMEGTRRTAMGDGRGKYESKRIFPLEKWYFRLYDSFSKPQKGGNKGKAQRRQYERRSRVGLVGWFVARNIGRLAPRVVTALLIMWLAFGHAVGLGGGPWVFRKAIDRVQSYGDGAVKSAAGGGQGEAVELASHLATGEDGGPVGRDAEVVAALAQANESLRKMREYVEDLEAENEQLAEQVAKGGALLALEPDAIILANGFRYEIGETLDYGPCKGETIESIEWKRRRVLLGDGSWLRLGYADGLRDAAGDINVGTTAGVREALRAVREGAQGIVGGP